ncbi:hypothetical protein ACHAO1_002032 [Botrytis cinerea]
MSDTRQNSGSNAHRATGTPSIQQTSQGTQTGIAFTTQVANTTQSESFELFGSLPFELKAKIWNIAAREVPRLVEITPRGNFQGHTPALLGVSHMAREKALEVYDTLRPGSPQPVYFNPRNDTLVFNIVTVEDPFPHGYPSFGIIGSPPIPSNFNLGGILASKGIKSFAFKIDGHIFYHEYRGSDYTL